MQLNTFAITSSFTFALEATNDVIRQHIVMYFPNVFFEQAIEVTSPYEIYEVTYLMDISGLRANSTRGGQARLELVHIDTLSLGIL